MRPWLALSIFLAVASTGACGDSVVRRPLELNVGNLSGRASKLVVDVFPGSVRSACTGVGLANVRELNAPISATWDRNQMPDNKLLELPIVDEDHIVIVVHSQDENGTPIQFVCQEIDYVELESPEVQVQLSQRI